MTKEEKLLKELYEKYESLHRTRVHKRDMIDGLLNRISISDDEEEVERHYKTLMNYSIPDYLKHSRITHKAFNEYHDYWLKVKSV